jgi:hypothetical protein
MWLRLRGPADDWTPCAGRIHAEPRSALSDEEFDRLVNLALAIDSSALRDSIDDELRLLLGPQ